MLYLRVLGDALTLPKDQRLIQGDEGRCCCLGRVLQRVLLAFRLFCFFGGFVGGHRRGYFLGMKLLHLDLTLFQPSVDISLLENSQGIRRATASRA